MCFVSFIPQKSGFLLGSNRDEHKGRQTASVPRVFESGHLEWIMPVDGKAGGSWIALRNDGIALVLLNGAFENHVRQPAYRHSRGLIIPYILQSSNPNESFAAFNLMDIEPFTLIIVVDGITEWRWDGEQLHRHLPDANMPQCWSSATLYDADQQSIRKQWFLDAIEREDIHNAETLLEWQTTGGYGSRETDIVLNRADGIGTVSTTVLTSSENVLQMMYEDYLTPGPKVVSFPPRLA